MKLNLAGPSHSDGKWASQAGSLWEMAGGVSRTVWGLVKLADPRALPLTSCIREGLGNLDAGQALCLLYFICL